MRTLLLSAAAFLGGLPAVYGTANSTIGRHTTPQTLRIVASALPSGTVQTAYGSNNRGFALAASGGVGPYSWSWAPAQGSSLPPSLSLSAAGLLSGIPTSAGVYRVTITVSDSESPTARASGNYSVGITVAQPVISAAPPNGTVGVPYGATFTIFESHCSATFSGWRPDTAGGWTLSAAPGSSLPPGLRIGTETYTCGGSTRCCVTVSSPILFHGTPTRAGTYHVVVTIIDSASAPAQASANYTITINGSTAAAAAKATAEVPSAQPLTHYALIDLGTFGGLQSYVNFPANYAPVLNDQGAVTGWADTSTLDPYPNFCFNQDCFVSHAFLWNNGSITNLGVIPGGSSSQASWISPNGLIAGISQNGETDPSFPGFPESRAVLWKNGEIIDLGTLPEGGFESAALAVNSLGQVVGAAANEISDSAAIFGLNFGWITQTRAFLWQNGVMQDLGTLCGADGQCGTDAVANLINDQGQIVGESYISSTPSPSCANLGLPLETRAFIWEHGTMKDLGSFGGTCTFATDLNDRGEVVGISTLPGDKFQHAFLWVNGSLNELPSTLGGNNAAPIALNNDGEAVGWASLPGNQAVHASLWKNRSMTDLGTLDGDPCSLAFSINARGQVVGVSGFQPDLSGCNSGNTIRAFLWEGDVIADLNALIPSGSALYLTAPETINDRGEIAGVGLDMKDGNQHAFLLIPCDQNHPNIEGCDYSPVDATAATQSPSAPSTLFPASQDTTERPKVVLPENIRKLLRPQRGFGRFVANPQKATSNDLVTISEPAVRLSPTSLTFSTEAIGTTSSAEVVTLKNAGTTSLTITTIAITGTNAGDFAQTHTCGSSLSAGTSCSISVAFKPTASGSRTAALSITDNAVGSPQKVPLAGIGTTAKLSPTSLSFGTVAIRTTSSAKTVTLTNVGATTLAISGITMTGTDAGDFTQTHNCGSSLAAGASCSISVAFKPIASGTRTATLSVADNADGSPQQVPLSGLGTTAKLFPTSLNFGTVTIGTTSLVETVTLTNVGTTSLTISGITITGANAGDFAQTHTCGGSLAAGATCSINITFKPTASGTRTASLSVSDNAAGNPQTVSLIGNCTGGTCLPEGAQCPPQFPPCCAGLVCVPASTRAFCEKP